MAEFERHLLEEEVEKQKQRTDAVFECKAAAKAFSDHLQQAEVMQRITPILFDSGRVFWVWSAKRMCYTQIDETDVLNAVKSGTGDRLVFTSKAKSEILETIRLTGREAWDRVKPVPESWIQFSDCVYDLRNNDMIKASPKYFFINPIPHNVGKSDECPTIDRLLCEWVGEEYKQFTYEIMAYCLYNGYPIHRVFVFFGGGRNGKGQFQNLIKNLVGRSNMTATTLEKLADSRFEAYRLRGKKLALIGETNFNIMEKTSQIKALSGGDEISTEIKGGSHIDFENTAKIVIATNSVPETTDKTRGNFSRWIILNFPNEFDNGVPVVDTIPEEEYESLCKKCLLYLKPLLERGAFDKEGSVEDRAKKYEETSNPVTKFISEMCVEGWNEKEVAFHFEEEYVKWCEIKRFRAPKKRALRKMLKEHLEFQDDYWYVDGERKQWQSVLHIRLRTSKFSTGDGDDAEDAEVSLLSTRNEGSESWTSSASSTSQPSKPTNLTSDSTPPNVWADPNAEQKLQHAVGKAMAQTHRPDVDTVMINEAHPEHPGVSMIVAQLNDRGEALGIIKNSKGLYRATI
jgi:P4 family phage/plasmid primase-like protien